MNADTQSYPDRNSPTALLDNAAGSLANGQSPDAATPPLHLLWETLESAYVAPEARPDDPEEKNMAVFMALPIGLVLSLVLWAIIVELVVR